MRNGFKKTLTVLASVTLAFSIAGCGASNNNNAESAANSSSPTASPQPKKEKVKLNYWTFQRHDAEYIKQQIQKFNETNTDNIEVEMTIMAENYAQSLDLAFTSNQAPDVFALQKAGPMEEYLKGYFEPLNKYLTDEMKSEFGKLVIEGNNQFDGNIISLPNSGATARLIYNVDMFEKAGLNPPKSLDEMVAAAKKITEIGKTDGIYGWSLPYKGSSSALTRSMAKVAEMNGFHSSGFDFKTGKYDFSGWKPIIEAFRQMQVDGSVLPGSEALDIDPMRAQFAEGKIGMYMSYSVEPGVYKDQFPTKIRWDAAELPTIDGGTPKGATGLVSAGIWLALSSKSEHKDEAWKFMSFMYQDEVLRGYHEQGFGLSVLPNIVQGAKEPSIPGIKNFQLTKYDAIWPIAPQGVTIEGNAWHTDFTNYIYNGGNLDKIIQDVNDRYNAGLNKGMADGSVKAAADPNFDPKSLQS